jgi:hypothetical protein
MDYIRSYDTGAFDPGRFDFQVLADLETCYFIVCRSPVGSGGPATHVHDCDQLWVSPVDTVGQAESPSMLRIFLSSLLHPDQPVG